MRLFERLHLNQILPGARVAPAAPAPAAPPADLYQLLFDADDYIPEWQMQSSERCALIMLLNKLRPEVAIEIGTAQGGSLSALARFARQVYSLDVNPACRERLGPRFPNVEFLTGSSHATLPPLLRRLQQARANLGLVLIDGDHTSEGLRRDIENLLVFRPAQPLYVLMHDSFNPDCRAGIRQADWEANPFVHCLDLDFVPGLWQQRPDFFYKEMWGGLALAVLLPTPRAGALEIQAGYEMLFRLVLPHSAHAAR